MCDDDKTGEALSRVARKFAILERARVQRTARFQVPREKKRPPPPPKSTYRKCSVCAWRRAEYESGAALVCETCVVKAFENVDRAVAEGFIKRIPSASTAQRADMIELVKAPPFEVKPAPLQPGAKAR